MRVLAILLALHLAVTPVQSGVCLDAWRGFCILFHGFRLEQVPRDAVRARRSFRAMIRNFEKRLQDNGRLVTGPADFRYDGEENGGDRYRVSIKGGKVCGADGQPLTTSGATRMVVIDTRGRLYIADKEFEKFTFHHTSLVDGGPVAFAGNIQVKDGVIAYLDRRSGHYLTSQIQLAQAVALLHGEGVDFSRCRVEIWDGRADHGIQLLNPFKEQ